MVAEQSTPRRDPGTSAEASALLKDFTRDGYVILEDALPAGLVDELRADYLAALSAKQKRFGMDRVELDRGNHDRYGRPMFIPIGGNHDVNRWNMHLPSRLPFLDSRVVANPRAMEIVDAVMGDDCVLTMLASDAATPGSQLQEIHQDALVTRLVINIPLVDCTDENGPIELWPGTHRADPFAPADSFEYGKLALASERIEELVAKIPLKRGIMRAGSILLRDQRLLHRGTQNRSNAVRPMLSLLYFAGAGARELPYVRGADLAARAALRARELCRKLPTSTRQAAALSRANAAGRIIEFAARSDRDHRRPIPDDVWQGMSDRARRLLRYAHVTQRASSSEDRSLKATYAMFREALTGVSASIGGAQKPPGRT